MEARWATGILYVWQIGRNVSNRRRWFHSRQLCGLYRGTFIAIHTSSHRLLTHTNCQTRTLQSLVRERAVHMSGWARGSRRPTEERKGSILVSRSLRSCRWEHVPGPSDDDPPDTQRTRHDRLSVLTLPELCETAQPQLDIRASIPRYRT